VESALGRILQGDREAEERHDPIAGELVDRALVLLNLVDQELVDLVHDEVGLFRPQPLGHGGVPHHVAEEHRHLAELAFDPVSLGEDFLGEALGEVATELGVRVGGSGFGRRSARFRIGRG